MGPLLVLLLASQTPDFKIDQAAIPRRNGSQTQLTLNTREHLIINGYRNLDLPYGFNKAVVGLGIGGFNSFPSPQWPEFPCDRGEQVNAHDLHQPVRAFLLQPFVLSDQQDWVVEDCDGDLVLPAKPYVPELVVVSPHDFVLPFEGRMLTISSGILPTKLIGAVPLPSQNVTRGLEY